MRAFSMATLTFGAIMMAAPAAKGQEARDWSLSGDLAAVSDYRYRGVSLTDREPAVQGELSLSAASGFYVYGWASSIVDIGDDVELMGALGWAGEIGGGFSLDAGAGGYAYPGVDDAKYYEFYAVLSRPIGMLTASGEVAYSPEQTNLGDQDNVYAKAGLSAPLPFTEASANVGLGWEDGAFGDDKVDWIAGVTLPLKPFELRVSYIGTNVDGLREAGDTVVAEIHWKFGG